MKQQEALDILKTGCNVFLTGSAGSGKTHVLNTYITYLRRNHVKVGITASTGVAATHINGMTINAWAGVGIKSSLTDIEIIDLLKRKYLHNRFKDAHALIIDEVSMLSSHTLEAVDQVLRAFKKNNLPFGGIQVVLCGDFFQLPPIDKDGSNAHFIYKSALWKLLDLKICYLDKPYRQNDAQFLQLLDNIRENNITPEMWNMLKPRFFHLFENGITPTRLYTHNVNADGINMQELAKIKEPEHAFFMEGEGSDTIVQFMKRNCLAPEKLMLKKRALVMFVKNNADEGYVNGTMGRVIEFTESDNFPIVETFDGRRIKVMPSEWTIEEDGEVLAKVTQLPLRLAWAITIHKSQGMTLDAAEIDLGKSFVTGMGYVALSRVKSLQGIRLRSLNRTALSVSNEVVRVDKRLRELSDETSIELRNSPWYKRNYKKTAE